jgi:hypothetical protein
MMHGANARHAVVINKKNAGRTACSLLNGRARPRCAGQLPPHLNPVRLAYQPPVRSTFLSEQTSHQQSASSTFLSEQISTHHQPPAKRTGH